MLEDRPIEARRISQAERAWRWCRRNRAVASLVGVAVVLLIAAVMALWVAATFNEQRLYALSQQRRAERAELTMIMNAEVANARAKRWSGEPGQRNTSLNHLTAAGHQLEQLSPPRKEYVEKALELRNEALACMDLVDLAPARLGTRLPETMKKHGRQGRNPVLAYDDNFARCAWANIEGGVFVGPVGGDGEVIPLQGDGLVTRMLYNAAGNLLAVRYGFRICSIRVWDLEKGEVVLNPSQHTQHPVDGWWQRAFDFSPDSTQMVCGFADRLLRHYDLKSGKVLKELPLSDAIGAPHLVRFHPTGKLVAVAGLRALEIYDLTSGEVVKGLEPPHEISALAWHPAGRLIAVGCRDGRIAIVDFLSKEQSPLAKGHRQYVSDLAFNHQGTLLASASKGDTVSLWDPYTAEELLSMEHTTHTVTFSRDDRFLGMGATDPASDADENTLFWEVVSQRASRRLRCSTKSVDIARGERLMASAEETGVRLWDLTTGEQVAFLPLGPTTFVRFHPQTRELFTVGRVGAFRWPLVIHGDPEASFARKPAPLTVGPPQRLAAGSTEKVAAALSDNGAFLLVARPNGSRLIDLANGSDQILSLVRPDGYNPGVAVSPTGKWCATRSWSGPHIRVWDLSTGQQAWHYWSPRTEVTFSPSGSHLVLHRPREYCFVRVGTWEFDGAPIKRVPHEFLPGCVVFSGDGTTVAVTTSRFEVKLLSRHGWHELATLLVPSEVWHLRFSPAGGILLATTADSTVHVFDVHRIRQSLRTMKLDWEPSVPLSEVAPFPPGVFSVRVDVCPAFYAQLHGDHDKTESTLLATGKKAAAPGSGSGQTLERANRAKVFFNDCEKPREYDSSSIRRAIHRPPFMVQLGDEIVYFSLFGGLDETSSITIKKDNGPSLPGSFCIDFLREDGGLSGDWTAIVQDVDVATTDCVALDLTVDVKAISHNLCGGGWSGGWEYPISVTIIGKNFRQQKVTATMGWYIHTDPASHATHEWTYWNSSNHQWAKSRPVPANRWHTETISLLDPALDLVYIRSIQIGGSGWDYHGRVDNVAIEAVVARPAGG